VRRNRRKRRLLAGIRIKVDTVSPAHRLIQDRLARLSEDVDALFTESRDRARREQAEQLNQAVRRLRIAGDPEELCGTLENTAGQFADGALLFRVEDGAAVHESIRVPLDSAAAFNGAVESREPQTAAAISAEISAELASRLDPGARASVFPVEGEDRVAAILYTWGAVQPASLELLAQVASVVWGSLVRPEPEPDPVPELVTIAPAPSTTAATWESLPLEEQQIHLRAQRFARVTAAEMRLFEADTVQSGRNHRDLYGGLRDRIDAARKSYREQFFTRCPSMVDYLHLEMLRTLANDDPDLFGKDYPGPLV
jgi:hypothetical protein